MLKFLVVVSLVLAGLFIARSTLRRRFFWSIRVTLGIYAVAFAVRLVLWPIFGGLDASEGVYTTVAGIGLVCLAIWLAARWLTDRYVESRRRRPRGAGDRRKPRRFSSIRKN